MTELDGLAYYGWPFTAFLVANILGMVTAGGLGDRLGPRLPLLAGLTVFTGGLLLAGLAPSMLVFVAGRALQGFGSGLVIVALYVVLGAVYPERARPAIFAALSAAWVIPALIGPPVAGAVHRSPELAPGLPRPAAVHPGRRRAAATRPAPDAGGGAVERGGPSVAAPDRRGARRRGGHRPAAVRRRPAGPSRPGRRARGRGRPRPVRPPAAAGRHGVAPPRAARGHRGAGAARRILLRRRRPVAADSHHGARLRADSGRDPVDGRSVGWSTGSWVQGRYPDVARFVFVRTGFMGLAAGCRAMLLIVIPGGAGWVAYPIWSVAGLGMGLAMPSVGVLLLEKSPPEQRGANFAAERGLLPLPAAVGIVNVAMAVLAATGALLAGRLRSAPRTAEPLGWAA